MDRIARGNGFRGILAYAFGDPNSTFLGTSQQMSGTDVDSLCRDFAASYALREDAGRWVWHNALRLPKGEHIPKEKLTEIAHAYMLGMKFKPSLCQYALVEHDLADGQHVHIIASRVNLDGSLFLGQNEHLISTRVIAQLEVEFGLTITKGPDLSEELEVGHCGPLANPGEKRAKRIEIEMSRRVNTVRGTTEVFPRVRLREMLNDAVKLGGVREFVEALEGQHVQVFANISTTRKISGLAFSYRGQRFKASEISKAFAWSPLSKTLGFDPESDFELLLRRRERFENTYISGPSPFPVVLRDIEGPPRFSARLAANGSILYLRATDDRLSFIDSGSRITFQESEKEVLCAGVGLALKKWPNGFRIDGTKVFKEKLVRQIVGLGLERLILNEDLAHMIADTVRARKDKRLALVARQFLSKSADRGDDIENPKRVHSKPKDGKSLVAIRNGELEARLLRVRSTGLSIQSESERMYARMSCDFQAAAERSNRRLDTRAWRSFDLNQAGPALLDRFDRERVGETLTCMSLAAVRSLDALEKRSEPLDLVETIISDYGDDIVRKLKAIELRGRNSFDDFKPPTLRRAAAHKP
jgi:hypothetical protein